MLTRSHLFSSDPEATKINSNQFSRLNNSVLFEDDSNPVNITEAKDK